MRDPSVSIVIVNFNGRHLLGPCLAATLDQAIPLGAEVIVVDNASSDGSGAYLAQEFSQVVLVRNERNEGFAGGCNAGVRVAKGATIVLLNNDAIPQPGWLRGLLDALEPPQVAIAASVVQEARYPSAYELGTGSISVIGHPIPNVGDDPEHPFYATGCSLAFKRHLFPVPFDPIYFAYYEDTLLSWRAHLRGFRVARALDSSVVHLGSATASREPTAALFYWERNKVLTLLLSYQSSTLWRLLPLYVFDGLARIVEDAWLVAKSPQDIGLTVRKYGTLIRALGWLLDHRAEVARRRQAIQSEQTQPDHSIVRMLSGKIFDDHVPTRPHRVANSIALAYCRLAGLRTADLG